MVTEIDSDRCFIAFQLENGSRYTFTYKGYLAGIIVLSMIAVSGYLAYSYITPPSFSYPKGMIACKSSDVEASVQRGN